MRSAAPSTRSPASNSASDRRVMQRARPSAVQHGGPVRRTASGTPRARAARTAAGSILSIHKMLTPIEHAPRRTLQWHGPLCREYDILRTVIGPCADKSGDKS